MTRLEVRKFSRWSGERSREHDRRHAETMRELETRIAAMRGTQ